MKLHNIGVMKDWYGPRVNSCGQL